VLIAVNSRTNKKEPNPFRKWNS